MEKQKKLVFKPAFPKYAKDKYDSFLLLKFFDTEEHRDYFLSGKLYMRQLTEFALQELGRGRSDYAEGAGLPIPYGDGSEDICINIPLVLIIKFLLQTRLFSYLTNTFPQCKFKRYYFMYCLGFQVNCTK